MAATSSGAAVALPMVAASAALTSDSYGLDMKEPRLWIVSPSVSIRAASMPSIDVPLIRPIALSNLLTCALR